MMATLLIALGVIGAGAYLSTRPAAHRCLACSDPCSCDGNALTCCGCAECARVVA